MIISRKHAKKLISKGIVVDTGPVLTNDGYYMYVTRTDMQRTDHYKATAGDLKRADHYTTTVTG